MGPHPCHYHPWPRAATPLAIHRRRSLDIWLSSLPVLVPRAPLVAILVDCWSHNPAQGCISNRLNLVYYLDQLRHGDAHI